MNQIDYKWRKKAVFIPPLWIRQVTSSSPSFIFPRHWCKTKIQNSWVNFKCREWLLPNRTEEVNFFGCFIPAHLNCKCWAAACWAAKSQQKPLAAEVNTQKVTWTHQERDFAFTWAPCTGQIWRIFMFDSLEKVWPSCSLLQRWNVSYFANEIWKPCCHRL